MSKYKTLLAQREQLEIQIEEARKTEVAEAIAQIHKIMGDFDLTVADIEKKRSKKQAMPNPEITPKYRNPESDKTWSGRGKPPQWIEGKNKADFLMSQPV